METTVEVFTFTIKKKRSRKEPFVNFADEPDLFNILTKGEPNLIQYIDQYVTGDIPAEKATVRIPPNLHKGSKQGRYLYGIIESGHYGKELEAVDKDDPKNQAKIIKLGKSKAILKPFFFYIKIPRSGDKGLLILERTGNDGIYPIFYIILSSFFTFHLNNLKPEDTKVDYTIEKGNIILKSYLEKFASSTYKSLTLTSNKIATDLANRYFGAFQTDQFSLELKLKFKNNLGEDSSKKIKELIDSGKVLFSTNDLNDIFENADKKVVAEINEENGKPSKARTYYLSEEQQMSMKPYYTIEVKENDKGFSDFASISSQVKNFIKENEEFNLFD